MVTLDQVQLLGNKIAKVIEHIDLLTNENTFLKEKLESYQKRIEELEILIQRFRDEQNLIEEGILASLNRLNQFEADVTKGLPPHEVPADVPAGDGEDAGEEGGGAELNVPAENELEESEEDIIFVSEGREENSIAGEDDEETVSPDKPVDSTELDIF